MAQDYPLEELSPHAFEQLTVALASEVMGAGVEAFGAGPDGGREATYDGPVEWSATTSFGKDSWNGYVVIQAKQREHLGEPSTNARWLRKRIDEELDAWVSSSSKRGRLPDYIVFVTNVRLSSVPGSGIDLINNHIRTRLGAPIDSDARDTLSRRGVRAAKVWHRDQLNALLTKHAGIRLAFKGLLTVGDLLSRLGELGGLLDPSAFQPVLVAHASATLGTERWVNFREAGGTERESVDRVVIDLRAQGAACATTVLAETIIRADQVLRPSYAGSPRHIVLTGQPGSGKSTITLFLNQLFRAGFASEEKLTDTAKEVIEATAGALRRLNLDAPKNRRWPIRVSLPEYADALGTNGDKSLLRWMCERISARAELDIKPNTLKRWLQHWPTLVILDGLDEVTAPEVRPRVLDEIRGFVEQADVDDADLLVIMTTRPTGEAERFMPERFGQLRLSYLDSDAALDYGRHITHRRLADDPDSRDQLIARFEREASNGSMLRLMKTPLQVLIITLILQSLGTLPADRYQLFFKYFETIYQREQAKTTSLSNLLSTYRPAIIHLHEAVGLELQIQSETATDARAILPKHELQRLTLERLIALGNDRGAQTERIAAQIVQAATERLVLLVPAENDGISFEIRSLQELMAARALSDAPDAQIRARLTLVAPSPHWRNTWTFLAGRLFADGPDHRRDLVVEVVEAVDRMPGWPGWLLPISSELAAALLEDGMSAAMPKWQSQLLDIGLRAIDGPMPLNTRMIAEGLSEIAVDGNRARIREAIKAGLDGSPVNRQIAELFQRHGKFGQNMQASWRSGSRPQLPTIVTRQPIADVLEPVIVDLGLDGTARQRLLALVEEIRGFGITDEWDPKLVPLHAVLPAQLPATLSALRDRDASAAVELAFSTLGPDRWTASAALGVLIGASLARTPVGDLLNSSATIAVTPG
ncbi:NACHT domain-containing protein [Leifsonia sp. NPDC058248]|uniref:NACHT domain-containing protein n=1 Tax=Leifsonia sp. NPDC058248 TaxID=3346402 RepID=UPI0036DF92FB